MDDLEHIRDDYDTVGEYLGNFNPQDEDISDELSILKGFGVNHDEPQESITFGDY